MRYSSHGKPVEPACDKPNKVMMKCSHVLADNMSF